MEEMNNKQLKTNNIYIFFLNVLLFNKVKHTIIDVVNFMSGDIYLTFPSMGES